MGRKTLVATVVIQFVVICSLGFLLVQGRRPSAERERVETAIADVRGALSVGANYTQFEEKVQALAGAVENLRAKGPAGSDLAAFDKSLKLYKDSIDLWSDELSYPGLYERSPHGRFVPRTLERVAKEQGLDLSDPEFSYKISADVLLQQLWAKADQARPGVNVQNNSPRPTTQPPK